MEGPVEVVLAHARPVQWGWDQEKMAGGWREGCSHTWTNLGVICFDGLAHHLAGNIPWTSQLPSHDKIPKVGPPEPVLVSCWVHAATLASGIFQHNQQPLPTCHNTSTDHHPHRRLLECRHNTVWVIFFISRTGDINSATVIAKVDVALIWPNDLPPVILWKPPIFPCPCQPFTLLNRSEVWDFTCNMLMIPNICQNGVNGGWSDTWLNWVANISKWCTSIFLGISEEELFGMSCKLWWSTWAREIWSRTRFLKLCPQIRGSRLWYPCSAGRNTECCAC